MSYLVLSVFKDAAGTYENGKLRIVPWGIQMRGVENVNIGIDGDEYCPPDVPPIRPLLHLWSKETGSIWVDETVASFETKRDDDTCCTSGNTVPASGMSVQTADYTLQDSDSGTWLYMNSASDTTVTVPAGLPANFYVTVVAIGGGTVTLDVSAVTNTGSTDLSFTETNSRVIHENGTDSVHVFGGGGASMPGNAAPTASTVAFTGTLTQGQLLTGTYVYGDVDSDAEGVTTFKWYRSDDTSGTNKVAISGATASTYTLQAGDVGKRIQFAVTPKAATGTLVGVEVFSAYSAAIAAASTFVAADLEYTVLIGSQANGVDPHKWEPTGSANAYTAWGGVSTEDLKANTEGYYVAKYGSAVTTVCTLQWQKSYNGGETYYGNQNYGTDENPMVGFVYNDNHFWRGKPGSLGGNGTIGYPWGTNAVDTGFAAASGNLWGMRRVANMDIEAITSTDNGATWTSHGVIMNYAGRLYPAYLQQQTTGVVLDTPQQTNATS